jgi:predicted PurR-regulated permease PerM
MPSARGNEWAQKGLFALAVLYTAYFAKAVLLPLVLAVLLTLWLAPVVRAMKRSWLPEPVGAAILVLALAAMSVCAVYLLFDPGKRWIESAPQVLRQAEFKLRGFKRSVQQVTEAAAKVDEITRLDRKEDSGTQVVTTEPRLASRVVAGTQSTLPSVAATIVLLYFLLASGDLFLRKLVRVTPGLERRRRAVRIARAIQVNLGRYLITVSCINAGLGLVTGMALYLLGMPNPILWGVMVAILNFMPYIGAAVSLVVLSTVAFLTFDSLGQVLAVPAVFFALTAFEGQILTPVLTGRRLALNPVAIFLSMLFWGWLWGVVGALIAVPILMVIKVLCEYLEPLGPVGEFIGGKATCRDGMAITRARSEPQTALR